MKKSDVKLLIAALKNMQKASGQLGRAVDRLWESGDTYSGYSVHRFIRDIEGTVYEEIRTLKSRIRLFAEISGAFDEDEMRDINKLAH